MLLRHAKFTTHAPLTLSVLLIDKRMTGSMTGKNEAGKVTNDISQFSVPSGLWTSGLKPLRTLEFVPSASHTKPFFSVQNL